MPTAVRTSDGRRIAVVTGASSGIGETFARRLAALGYEVVLVARRAERLAALARDLEATRCMATAFPCDLGSPAEIERLLAMLRGLPAPHLLVNNAGFGAYAACTETPPETLRRMVRLNVEALLMLAREVAPLMAHGGGIVNVASTAAFQPLPYFGAYAATKAFVLSFSEALRVELRGRITVVCVCPGYTASEFHGVAKLGNQFRGIPPMAPEKVVRVALRQLARGGGICIPGPMNRIQAWLSRVMPHGLVLAVSTRLFRRSDGTR